MPITATDLKWMRSAIVSDSGTNGGALGSSEIINGLKNNIFGDVSESERLSGSETYRKVFIKLENAENLPLISPKVFMEAPTAGDDAITLINATAIDTKDDIDGTYNEVGCATLSQDILAGSFSLTALLDINGATTFEVGDSILISDTYPLGTGAGNSEFRVIDSVSYDVDGDLVTITVTEAIGNNYTNGVATVSGVLDYPAVEVTMTNFTTSTSGGIINSVDSNLIGYQLGAKQETISIVMTSDTAYEVTGSVSGNLGVGSINSDYTAIDDVSVQDMFVIPASFWGGAWSVGDTITFEIIPAVIPLWVKREVPVDSTTISGNSVVISVRGESN
jgi:hypothetical protein